MSTTTTYPFTTSGNYTASASDFVEVSGGVGTLSDLVDDDDIFAVTFNDGTTTAARSIGTATPTDNGGSVSGGYYVISSSSQRLRYADATNFPPSDSGYTFRTVIRPNISGTPSGNIYVAIHQSDSTSANKFTLYYNTAKKYGFQIFDGSGSSIVNTSTAAAYSWVEDVDVELELAINPDAGTYHLFVDGVVAKTGTTTPWSTATQTNQYLMLNNTQEADICDYKYLQWFSSAKHSADYSSDLSIDASDTAYSLTNPTLLTNTAIVGNIASFSVDDSVSGSDALTYVLNVDGTDKYWDGSAWSTSSGYAQSNTEADINGYAPLLNPGNASIKVKVYLHSDDGTTTPTIDLITITYDASDSAATEPTLCFLEGYLYDHNGPNASQLIEVRPAPGFNNSEIFVNGDWQDFATTDSTGYFGARIWENTSVGGQYEFRIGSKKYKLTVPNATTAKWTDQTITVVTND